MLWIRAVLPAELLEVQCSLYILVDLKFYQSRIPAEKKIKYFLCNLISIQHEHVPDITSNSQSHLPGNYWERTSWNTSSALLHHLSNACWDSPEVNIWRKTILFLFLSEISMYDFLFFQFWLPVGQATIHHRVPLSFHLRNMQISTILCDEKW